MMVYTDWKLPDFTNRRSSCVMSAMPRMDGITMLERLEKLLPDSVAIFMSGYSDKEYLKAAIKLKAVNYIEKPFSLSEIEDAIQRCPGALSTESPFPPRRNAALHGDSLPACPAAHTSHTEQTARQSQA